VIKLFGLLLVPFWGILKWVKNLFAKHEIRKDVLDFFQECLKSNVEMSEFLIKNLKSYEQKFGRYRFDKLLNVLREMKICNYKRGPNGNLIIAPFFSSLPPSYDARYIQSIIDDIKKGHFDHLL
jgi:hypothetical protein